MDERGRRARAWVVAIGVAAGATLAGIGVSAAQTGGSGTTDNGTATAPAEAAARPMRGPGGPGGHKGFGGGGIHGEFVTRNAAGNGYQTIATQGGEVTEVNENSITVKSEDGYTKKYVIDDNNTNVTAGDDGTEDIKVGDQVHVTAIKDGDTYRAFEVHDGTQGRRIGEQFRPGRPAAAPDAANA
jgi:hypothetical protein